MTRQPEQSSFGQWVRHARIQHGLTQIQLADLLGIDAKTVQRWENSPQLPRPYLFPKLVAALGPLPEKIDLELNKQAPVKTTDASISESGVESSGVWNVPHLRNFHFTGRDDLLDRLHRHLTPTQQSGFAQARRVALTQPLAVKGLGGIGKTQIAIEYAYRSREQGYYTHTLWVNAASEEAIITSFVTIAELLPEFAAKNETDQRKLVLAVKRWIEQSEQRWLLIFDNVDNADDLHIIQEYLPHQGNGSVLLTTRANAVGSLAASIEVGKMGLMEGTEFLLHRAQRFVHASDEEINEATNVVIALDHFPLALDQAGAYIEETKCGFVDYLQIYQDHRKVLHARRGLQTTNYPDSVATTWSLSFQKVEQANPAAAELLRLCAFLAPDKIPEELIRDGAVWWSPLLQQAAADLFSFNQMITELLKFSLVERLIETQTLSIHRLVQAVQMDTMEPEMQRQWAERVVRALNDAFPDANDVTMWPRCLRYLSQVQACNTLIVQHMLLSGEAARLLNQAGMYMVHHALYTVAQPLIQYALAICEQQLGVSHPNTASSVNNLAVLYRILGKYAEAEPLYQRALAIRERHLGPDHPQTAISLSNLALLYQNQRKYAEAEPLYQRALAIREQSLGPDHPDTAQSLSNLAVLYDIQGKYTEAEPLFLRSLTIREQHLGPDHPDVASSLSSLALLYKNQRKYAEAGPLFLRSLTIREQSLVPDHPETARNLNNLAVFYDVQGKYAEAEPLYQRGLTISERRLGVAHPDTLTNMNNLAGLYESQGKYAESEALYQRTLAIREQELGASHPDTVTSLNNLACLYQKQGRYAEAEPLHQRALKVKEEQLGAEHPSTATSLNNLAGVYKSQGRYAEAEPLYLRSLKIREEQLGPTHPDTATSLNNLAYLYQQQARYAEAESLYQRALKIREEELGARHPSIITSLDNLAYLYQQQGRYAEAKPLYQRTLAICEDTLGREHPTTQNVSENYATLLRTMINDVETKKLEEHS